MFFFKEMYGLHHLFRNWNLPDINWNEISQFVYSQFLIVYAFLFTKSGGAYHNIVKL
jgi:hypothetical protein